MFRGLKKTIAVCLIGFGIRYINGYFTSYYMVVNYNRYNNYSCWNIVAFMLKGGKKNVCSGKKGS